MPSPSQPLHSRIAPTPSGYIHLGNAVSFLLTWALVRSQGGALHLRIDDLDAPRMRPEFVEDLFRQLEWLGVDYDSGPGGPEDLEKRFSQRLRLDRYSEVLRGLAQSEAPVFACRCSRSEIRASSGSLVYPGTCRDQPLSLDEKDISWRVRVQAGTTISWTELSKKESEVKIALDHEVGDYVVRRRDGVPGYHLVSLVDDLDAGINLVVRGEELLTSSAAQVSLSRFVPEGKKFAQSLFLHHPVLPGPDGLKLSKSRDSSPLREWRKKDPSPAGVYRAAGALIGQADASSLDDLRHAVSDFYFL